MQSAALRRSLVVCALMLGVAGASVVAVPTERLADTRLTFDLESAIPKQFGDWQVDASQIPIPPSPDQQSAMNQIYDQILGRTYVNSRGERIMLAITYGSRQNQQMRAHRQEVCYSAQGFKITDLERMNLTLASGAEIPATRMVATHGGRVEPVTYWFTMGDEVVLSYMDRELAQLRFALSGYVPDGYLVRVSSLGNPTDAGFAKQLEFVNALMPNVPPELRRRLTGHT
ncbi:MAG: EpsI family protein [Burkholderiales bacterium]